MRLESVSIQNFCSCTAITIPLNSFNPIIGYNNSGKSNILRAISWLLRKSVLSAHVFTDTTQPVIIEGTISSVNISQLPQNQQAQISRYISGNALNFRRRQDAPNVPAAQVRIEVLDPQSGQWIPNPTGLDNAIGVLFPDPLYIEAMDDAADDISRFAAKNTIGLLLKYSVDLIRSNNSAALQALLTDIQNLELHLAGQNRLQELTDLETQATTEINAFFPGIGIHLDIQTPILEEIIKSATISLSDGQGLRRPFTSFGHGAQRTVQMALIKLLASHANQRNTGNTTTLLLIDEPELYLHPQAIELLRDSLETLSQHNFQVIFSTHSPLMLGNSHVLNTSIIYRDNANGTATRTKLSTAASTISTHTHQANVIFSLQHATYLLFSEKVFIVEGKTEMMLIPEIYRTITNHTLSQHKSCLIEGSSSSAIWPMIQVLQGIGFTPKAVADLDYIFKVATNNGLINRTDPDFITCLNWFTSNQTIGGFFIGTDGFPTKKDTNGNIATTNPEQAFSNMALALPTEVSNLARQLSAHGIWIWQRGAFESCLGIEKNDISRLAFISTLHTTQNLNHATHPTDLTNFVSWALQ